MNYQSEAFRNDTKLEGRYANYFKVGHNAFEFVLDFRLFYAESQEAELCTRIITPPIYAKTLLKTLRGAIEHYEQTFGVIPGEDEKAIEHSR
jgi:hypothetical protein